MDIENFMDKVVVNKDDYINDDGLLICGTCKRSKEKVIKLFDKYKKMPCACYCMIKRKEQLEIQEKRQKYERRMQYLLNSYSLIDKHYIKNTFKNDDGKQPSIIGGCKNYVRNWPKMKANNIGIIFLGDVGCGKTFYACCIANELIKGSVFVKVISTAKLLNLLDGAENKQAVIDNLNSFELLVLDDLGAERNTSYALEQLFNVIDCRLNSRLPLIITTNVGFNDFEKSHNIEYKRIFDRVIEACPIKLGVTGKSKRVENSRNREIKAMGILKGGS